MSNFEGQQLGVSGAWRVCAPVHEDVRGSFREWFKTGAVEHLLDRPFPIAQANTSFSRRGVIRGIHYSIASQAKLVTCVSGKILDVSVDLRKSSADFGKFASIELSSESGDAVFLSSGLGHGFSVLSDEAVVVYLMDSTYSPTDEFEVNALDPKLGINWLVQDPLLSSKDRNAPALAEIPLERLPD